MKFGKGPSNRQSLGSFFSASDRNLKHTPEIAAAIDNANNFDAIEVGERAIDNEPRWYKER